MHIELKVPEDLNIKTKYRYNKAAKKLEKLIYEYGLAEMSMI